MKIGVIGAGNWGTELARLLSEKGLSVNIWAYEPEVAEGINRRHKNPLYLSDITLPDTLKSSNDITEIASDKDLIVFAIPSQFARTTAKKLRPHLKKDVIFVSCTKGVEAETGRLISDVLAEALPDIPKGQFCFLSGPSFASEVSQKLPTTVVVASKNLASAKTAQEIFRTDWFMTFTSDDVIGVQVGGAVKNVIAIACGISDALGFGYNTRAAIITRGLYEMIKIGRALGANPITFAGLAGIGDLVLTCTSELSRNRQAGFQIGNGVPLADIKKNTRQIAEGIETANAVFQLIKKLNLAAPICTEVYRMIHEGKPPKKAVEDLTKIELHEELRGII